MLSSPSWDDRIKRVGSYVFPPVLIRLFSFSLGYFPHFTRVFPRIHPGIFPLFAHVSPRRLSMYEDAVSRFLDAHSYPRLTPRAALFDMDGVLFNSMPYHATAWHEVMKRHGLNLSREEAFMNEGRTGPDTINRVYRRQHGTDAPEGLADRIYAEKSAFFAHFPEPPRMTGAYEMVSKIVRDGMTPVVVTGSGQRTLLNRLQEQFDGMFTPDHIVTAYDVRFGKPRPEPYLMGLHKAGVQAWEAIVVENAPIGVQAGVAAGVFTVAVNTGPLPPSALLDAGAHVLFPSMMDFCNHWEELSQALKQGESKQ